MTKNIRVRHATPVSEKPVRYSATNKCRRAVCQRRSRLLDRPLLIQRPAGSLSLPPLSVRHGLPDFRFHDQEGLGQAALTLQQAPTALDVHFYTRPGQFFKVPVAKSRARCLLKASPHLPCFLLGEQPDELLTDGLFRAPPEEPVGSLAP